METENWEWEWEEAQTEFGGMKKRGSEGGSEGALLDEG